MIEASVPTIILFCVIREDVDDLYKWQMFQPSSLHQRQILHADHMKNCTVVSFSTIHVPFCTDGGDLCEADDSMLATVRSRMPQLPPRFSEVSHAAKTVFFLHVFLLKVEKLQPSSVNLVEHPEVDDNELLRCGQAIS